MRDSGWLCRILWLLLLSFSGIQCRNVYLIYIYILILASTLCMLDGLAAYISCTVYQLCCQWLCVVHKHSVCVCANTIIICPAVNILQQASGILPAHFAVCQPGRRVDSSIAKRDPVESVPCRGVRTIGGLCFGCWLPSTSSAGTASLGGCCSISKYGPK